MKRIVSIILYTEKRKFYKGIRAILRTELNVQNQVIAVNTLVIRVMSYRVNMINWALAKIIKMDTKFRNASLDRK